MWNTRLRASARVVKRSRSLGYLECDVVDREGSLVCRLGSTCMVLRGEAAALKAKFDNDFWVDERGGFYASQDADIDLDDDGDYFTWTRAEAAAVLTPEEMGQHPHFRERGVIAQSKVAPEPDQGAVVTHSGAKSRAKSAERQL